jgi:hypothetical protein
VTCGEHEPRRDQRAGAESSAVVDVDGDDAGVATTRWNAAHDLDAIVRFGPLLAVSLKILD